MDGENNGSKPYEQMDDFGRFSLFVLVQHPHQYTSNNYTLIKYDTDSLWTPP